MLRTGAARAGEMGFRVVGSVAICRHGDRAPAHNLFDRADGDSEDATKDSAIKSDVGASAADHRQSDPEAEREREIWTNLVASGDQLAELSRMFPVRGVKSNKAGSPCELVENAPWVNSSSSATSNASSPFGRITKLGLDQLEARGRELRERYGEWLKPERTIVYSTNYSRTQHSAQSFLKGLFGSNSGGCNLSVRVPPLDNDVANSWEMHERLRHAVISSADLDPFIRDNEEEYIATREAMIKALPYYEQDPARFLWIYSCDYFVCRQVHDLPLKPELLEHRDHVLSHTFKRFLHWYSQDDISKLAAGDILNAVREKLEAARAPGQEEGQFPLFTLYSGHDITVLPVLVALGIIKKGMNGLHFDTHWPRYGTTVVFELLEQEAPERGHFMRVLVNDEQALGPIAFGTFWENVSLP